jgi:UDP-N-acetyl-D-glucosamine/UDP-N-acetyl-D-galactosamine dehydrogenase
MHKRKIAVIGLGYVGLPVAVAFAQQGQVIGFDINPDRLAALRQGIDITGELADGWHSENLVFTDETDVLQQADFYIIAVPTPVDAAKQPDLLPVLKASKTVGNYLKAGDIVVYESTVYPGATEEMCIPVLERQSKLRCGQDFGVGYSPERINPGDPTHNLTNVIKVVSGCNVATLDMVAQVYESVVNAGVHRASSIKIAEAAKVIENTQRDVNIALINELAMIFNRLGMDTQEVLAAARTKWNFLPFTPGLVGGHCIGVDPYYLVHKAQQVGYQPQLIPAARSLNESMGDFIAGKIIELLVHSGCLIQQSTVTIFGLAFKENVADLRNTRVIDIVRILQKQKITVQIHDHLVNEDEAWEEYEMRLQTLSRLRPAQCVVLAVAHDLYLEWTWQQWQRYLEQERGVMIDIKGVLPRYTVPEQITLWRL